MPWGTSFERYSRYTAGDQSKCTGQTRKGGRNCDPPFGKNARRRPTLPHRHQCSTIGSEGLSFRVRNVTGRFPFDMAAETLLSWVVFPTVTREPHSGRDHQNLFNNVEKVSSPRTISTGQLHTLPCFHIQPINAVIYCGPYQVNPVRVLILRRASRLDAFSGYPFRT